MSLYVYFEGVKGECAKTAYKGFSDAQSMTLSTEKPGEGSSGQSRRRGDVKFNDIELVRLLDSASPTLIGAVATSRIFGQVLIVLTSSFAAMGATSDIEQVIMKVLLSDAIVNNYSLETDPDEPPSETLSINFARIAIKYFAHDSNGVEQAGIPMNWDCEAVNEWKDAPRL